MLHPHFKSVCAYIQSLSANQKPNYKLIKVMLAKDLEEERMLFRELPP